ncbi:glycosyltransferase involved in cell wall biosynthesis [Evansella vedderi]|uniref:Glycosyltransferase involved in cell wall biosynthesis n=1 Tax=Evansella vedderi TaxID=38282 RepID=A0ABT9ZUB1_9BACI|nr:glycosyltransferase family 4 protein [Evansella vedderi]MDQ0254469.1 glycosyltransferase involved in cell wall biosynthesis [Evansella vedderi]
MNILYLTDDEITSGGAVKEHINAICRGFKNKGHKVTLICPSIDRNASILVDQVITYGSGRSIPRVVAMLKTIKKLLNEENIDAIYMRYRASQLPLYFLKSFTAQTRYLEINGIAEKEMRINKFKYLLIRFVQKIIERPFFLKSSGVFTVTKEIASYYKNNYNIQKENIYVFNNGVWPERFETKPNKRKSEKITLGFVGNIVWWQGLETVIKAIGDQNYRDKVDLTIVGSGDELEKLKRLAESLDASNIQFLGQVPSDEIPKIMTGFDIGIVSKSIKGEGLSPIKLYEYWAAGLPVIATNLPGLDIVENIEGGLNYEMDDVDSLKSSLNTLLNDKSKWEVYGENGRRYVEEYANWHNIGDSTVKIIEGKSNFNERIKLV